MGKMQRGVLVDSEGFMLGAFEWDATKPMPKVNARKKNQKRIPPKDRKHILTDAAAIEDPNPRGKWNFEKKIWELPTERVWFADSVTGEQIGSALVWRNRLAPPPGMDAVFVEPPAKNSIWTGSEWSAPRRMVVLDANDVVVNVALENPRQDTANVLPPDGGRSVTPIAGLNIGAMLDGQKVTGLSSSVRKDKLTDLLPPEIVGQFNEYAETNRLQPRMTMADVSKFLTSAGMEKEDAKKFLRGLKQG